MKGIEGGKTSDPVEIKTGLKMKYIPLTEAEAVYIYKTKPYIHRVKKGFYFKNPNLETIIANLIKYPKGSDSINACNIAIRYEPAVSTKIEGFKTIKPFYTVKLDLLETVFNTIFERKEIVKITIKTYKKEFTGKSKIETIPIEVYLRQIINIDEMLIKNEQFRNYKINEVL